jgi:hypothetical protein
VQSFIVAGQKKIPDITKTILTNGLNLIEYAKYGIVIAILNRDFGQSAVDVGYDVFKCFAAFDETQLIGAYEALDKVYPSTISSYYRDFVRSRKRECARFVREYNDTRATEDRS